MAKVYTGRDGRLLIDGTEQIKVSNWTLTGSLEVLETTTLGESQRSYAPGVQEFNGTATLLYYKDDAGRNDAATGNKWRYDGPPAITSVRPGISSVTVKLVGVL